MKSVKIFRKKKIHLEEMRIPKYIKKTARTFPNKLVLASGNINKQILNIIYKKDTLEDTTGRDIGSSLRERSGGKYYFSNTLSINPPPYPTPRKDISEYIFYLQ